MGFITLEEKIKRNIFASQLSDMVKDLQNRTYLSRTSNITRSEREEQVPDLPIIEYKIRTAAKYASDFYESFQPANDYSKLTNNVMMRYREAILKEVSEAIQLLKNSLDFVNAKMPENNRKSIIEVDIRELGLFAAKLTFMEQTFRRKGILQSKKKDPVSLHIENINC